MLKTRRMGVLGSNDKHWDRLVIVHTVFKFTYNLEYIINLDLKSSSSIKNEPEYCFEFSILVQKLSLLNSYTLSGCK